MASLSDKPLGFGTRLLRGGPKDVYEDGATLPPVFRVNAFSQGSAEDHEAVFANRKPGFAYTRVGNPTVAALERAVNDLEDGALTVAYASGMAALSALFLSVLHAGDRLVVAPGLYGGTIELLHVLERLGIEVAFVEECSPEAFSAALDGRTRLAFCETIANPRLDVADVRGIAEAAHTADVPLAVDNTMATPYLVTPLDLGADFVVHSTSKYLDGTSTELGGTLTYGGRFAWDAGRYPATSRFSKLGKLAIAPVLRQEVSPALGGCMSPQAAFDTLVGTQTLAVRMGRICDNALGLAVHLAAIAASDRCGQIEVGYPGLAEHPDHDMACGQFGGRYGGVLTLRVGSRERAFGLLDGLGLVSIVSNVGDVRTLACHPATTIAAHLGPSEREASGASDDLVRVCVGIEDLGDLEADFDQALDHMERGR